jgi:chemotaxis signal transduction protein
MELIKFETTNGTEYVAAIKDLLAIVCPNDIIVFPGASNGIVGITKHHNDIIPVIDTAMLHHGIRSKPELMIVTEGLHGIYGILIKYVSNIIRNGNIPGEIRFLDPNDYVNSILCFDNKAEKIELF